MNSYSIRASRQSNQCPFTRKT